MHESYNFEVFMAELKKTCLQKLNKKIDITCILHYEQIVHRSLHTFFIERKKTCPCIFREVALIISRISMLFSLSVSPWKPWWSSTRVSLFRSFLIFASKRNEAKRILFRFIFACFCETKKVFFRFISHRFASIFFAISHQPFRFKTVFASKRAFCH
jgi:hypothetical protein